MNAHEGAGPFVCSVASQCNGSISNSSNAKPTAQAHQGGVQVSTIMGGPARLLFSHLNNSGWPKLPGTLV